MLVLRFLINGRLGNKLCSIIELDKGQEKISKHDFEKSFMYYIKVICHPVGLLVLRFLIKWLYLSEGIRIGWHHRKMATNPINMLWLSTIIRLFIRWTSVHMHQIYDRIILTLSPMSWQTRTIKAITSIEKDLHFCSIMISCVGENQSLEFQSFSLQTEILILSPTGMTGKNGSALVSFGYIDQGKQLENEQERK